MEMVILVDWTISHGVGGPRDGPNGGEYLVVFGVFLCIIVHYSI